MNLSPFALERFFAQYEFTTRHLLCSSDAESISLDDVLALEAGADKRLLELRLGYTESRGSPELRRAIASLYGSCDEERVLVHSGAEEPIFTFMNAILSAGDNVIVQFPCYQSQYSIAESLGAQVTRWESDLAREGAPDLDELERLVRPATRAIVITTPNNPTGYPMSRSELDAVVSVARRHGLWLFGDEVYRGVEREAEQLPAVCDVYERGVSLGSLAKVYGLAGLRIGWIATKDRALYETMATIKDYLTICNSAPSEILAAVALRNREPLVERVRRIIAQNLDRLEVFFARCSEVFEWTRPRAGTTAFPRYLGGSSEAFCSRLVQRAGVLLLPSTLFDAGDDRVRFGYARSSMPEALRALEEFLANDRL